MVVRSEDLEVIFSNNSSITDRSPLANLMYRNKERKAHSEPSAGMESWRCIYFFGYIVQP